MTLKCKDIDSRGINIISSIYIMIININSNNI